MVQGNERRTVRRPLLAKPVFGIGRGPPSVGIPRWMILVLFAVLASIASPPACAGELRVAQAYKGYCDLEFIGTIAKGDARKFDYDAIENLGTQGASVCLDSAGGSFPEAISIAQHSDMLGMVIAPGARCLSACAILFSGGRISSGMGIPLEYLNRVVWPGGRLGFHAPSLDISGSEVYSKSDIDQAFNIALASTKEIYNLNNRYGYSLLGGSTKFVSDYVFGLILDTPPTDMHDIDTVGEAILSNFDVPTSEASHPLDKQSTLNACKNKYLYDNFQYATNVRLNARSDTIPSFIENFVSNHDEGINFAFRKVDQNNTTGIGIVFPVFDLSANGGNTNARTNICVVFERKGDEGSALYVTLTNLQTTASEYESTSKGKSDDLLKFVFNIIYKNYVTDLGEDDYSFTDFQVDPIYKIDPLKRIAELAPDALESTAETDADGDRLPLRVIPQDEYRPEALDEQASAHPDKPDGDSHAAAPPPVRLPGFTSMVNTDFGGTVTGTLRDVSLEGCVSACAADRECEAYTYDRWNRWCFTKAEVSDRSISAKAVSGLRANLTTPPAQTGGIEMRRYRGKAFPDRAYRSDTERDSEACESACRRDDDCIAYTFRKPRQRCERFRSAPEYKNERGADSGAKFQIR